LHGATAGERRWWVLPTKLNDVTKEAIAVAVARGWMIDRALTCHRTSFTKAPEAQTQGNDETHRTPWPTPTTLPSMFDCDRCWSPEYS
jgi:hypothetical protein